ncbi:uncharacterized protein ASPGLDRAFT_1091503 [Aspergillus glaucus CBS 516.65]|uniref:Uncharacterized protein n=1 Tax=Aspergillus glaucus CBS 516.65 TaxID=1160497 RepID=A0A1L9V4N4_ASPGL|nr:hypothetical protein ASPGLDRAFT_1091503 [Aspergillus glaucus CBS 516.65]OJJ78878.1 hypothetical protein ASPGLDRAFT_1091503 [Aspergillus glaucus CBS 516.65]
MALLLPPTIPPRPRPFYHGSMTAFFECYFAGSIVLVYLARSRVPQRICDTQHVYSQESVQRPREKPAISASKKFDYQGHFHRPTDRFEGQVFDVCFCFDEARESCNWTGDPRMRFFAMRRTMRHRSKAEKGIRKQTLLRFY